MKECICINNTEISYGLCHSCTGDKDNGFCFDASGGVMACEHYKSRCPHYIYQTDSNGWIAICYCNVLGKDSEKAHEGNCGQYECPLDVY
jgi:hypothetical protein